MDPKAVLNSSDPRHGALITRQAVLWRGLPNSASDAFDRRFRDMYALKVPRVSLQIAVSYTHLTLPTNREV